MLFSTSPTDHQCGPCLLRRDEDIIGQQVGRKAACYCDLRPATARGDIPFTSAKQRAAARVP
jgi:hypothetical protein